MSRATSSDALSDLIGLVYESTLDPTRWTAFLARFAQAVDGRASSIFMHDFGNSESAIDGGGAGIGAIVNFDPASMRSFVEHYDRKNVWAHNDAALQEGVAVTSDMLFPDAKLYGTEWGADWLKPQGLKYCMGGIVMRRGTVAVKFTSLRASSQRPFGEKELRLCRLLLPHLRHASVVHVRMHQLAGRNEAAAGQMDALPFGVLFLSSNGRALHANAFARHLAARRDGFTLDAGGQFRLGANGEESRLHRMIRQSARTSSGEGNDAGGAMRISRRNGPPLSVRVAPIRSAHARGVYDMGIAPAVVLLISDPEAAPRTTVDTLCGLYGLTPTEASLTAALIRGVQPAEFARERSTSRHTVATQLKSVMHKLSARRQADIVRIVLSGPAALAVERPPA